MPKTPRSTRPLVGLALAFALASPAIAAAADTKAACFDAYVDAQKSRKSGKLRQARTRLVACSQEACPAAVRKDCAQWLSDVTAEIPSVLVAATDAKGKDTAAVRVSVDAELLVEKLDGTSIDMDPGEHTFTFEHAGKTQTQTVVVRQSERNRKLLVDFSTPKPVESKPPPPPPVVETPRPAASTPVAVYVLGGVGIVSLAAGAFFYFDQKRLHDDLAGRCAPACSPDDVSPLKTKQLLAGLGAGVGVAALGAATVLYLTRPTADGPRSAVGVLALPGGAGLSYGGGF